MLIMMKILIGLIMFPRGRDGHSHSVSHATFSRRKLLAVSGAVAAAGLSGCLSQVASSVTNTESSPAAVFAGTDWNDHDTEVTFTFEDELLGKPHVARLTPTLAERVELEGWVTSSAVMAQNHNSSRSNRHSLRGGDGDSDADGVGDGDEDDELVAYLGGKPVVGERFTVSLPDAEVPGGDGSIREAVTPERLIAYLTGGDGGGILSKASSKSRDVGGGGDCDDDDPRVFPGAVCGTTPHFIAEVTGPVATGGSVEAVRADDGTVVVINSPPEADGGLAAARVSAEGGSDGPESSTEAIYQAWTGSSNSSGGASPEIVETLVAQVLVQPPKCPVPFPALFYVGRAESDGQFLYSGGWVIDDAALYENSATVLTLAGSARVVGIECCFDYDSDGDGFGDVVARAGLSERERQGARPAAGPVEELVKSGVLSESVGEDILVRKRPGREQNGESRGDVTGDEYGFVTNVPVDAPVLHLVNAASASNEVKFKAGAELSKSVN